MSTAADVTYETTIEDAGPCRKKITITIPAELIDAKIRESLGTLAGTATLPGFRQGRAPMHLIERRFGSAVRDETKNQVLAEGYSKAIENHELQTVTEPEPVDDLTEIELRDGESITYAVEVEVVPEFELPDFASLELKRPIMEVTDEIYAAELNRQCTQAGEVEEIENGFAEGDKIVGPGQAIKEGDDEPFFSHDAIDIIVPGSDDGGQGHVLGLIIDGLADMLKDKKVGDELSFEVVGPESHELEHIRGKKLTITLTIEKGLHINPAEPEALVERFGFENEAMLKEQLMHALEHRLELEQQSALRDQVYRFLGDSADFELPKKLTENQAARLLERHRLELMYRGALSNDEIERRLAELRNEADEFSQRRLKLQFLLHRLSEKYDVSVNEQEVNARIVEIARQRGARPDQLRNEMARTGALQQLAVQIRDHKACDAVVAESTVTEMPVDEWRELMEKQNADAKA